jgi:broad specificity phosphatase PhoE
MIWVTRHGERADVVDDDWARTAARPHDPPLTALGRRQAAATAQALTNERIETVFSSPFLRCVQTAAIIAAHLKCTVCIEPGLGELLNPRWFSSHPVDAGMSQTVLQAAAAQATQSGGGSGAGGGAVEPLIDDSYRPTFDTTERRSDGRFGAHGDFRALCFPEGAREAADRYAQVFAALEGVARHSLLVTHGFGVQAVAELIGGAEIFECDYCALTSLCRPDAHSQWRCAVLCDASHLSGLAVLPNGHHDGHADGEPPKPPK